MLFDKNTFRELHIAGTEVFMQKIPYQQLEYYHEQNKNNMHKVTRVTTQHI